MVAFTMPYILYYIDNGTHLFMLALRSKLLYFSFHHLVTKIIQCVHVIMDSIYA